MTKLTLICFGLLLALPACSGESEPAKTTPAKPKTPAVKTPETTPETTGLKPETEPEAPTAPDAMAKAKEMVARVTKLAKEGDIEGAKKLLGELQSMNLTDDLKKQVADAANLVKAKDVAGGLLGR